MSIHESQDSMTIDVYNEDKFLGGAKGETIHGQLGLHIFCIETMGNEFQISTVYLCTIPVSSGHLC